MSSDYHVTLTRDEMRWWCYYHKIAADSLRQEFNIDDNTDTWQLPTDYRVASHYSMHLTFKGILTRTGPDVSSGH